ncbi:D-alanine--D-alanine ligase family protein [Desulfovibrio inopinatus]|uniref:D-alanine--D-alanine ligase family protein n=1 Tax=Desulfovibrio inopinatus TaxID=102109 RepID=UPI0004099C82|nr:hypothetical protein [Desulfovibrio inopinatus]
MRVCILHDKPESSLSVDDADTIVQAQAVANALREAGHTVFFCHFELDLTAVAKTIRALSADLVFNFVEGAGGKAHLSHLAPLVLEEEGVAFTGAGSRAMYLSTDKLTAKELLAHSDLPTPAWVTVESLRRANSASMIDRFDAERRFILKSVFEHASKGLDDGCVLQAASSMLLETALEEKRASQGGRNFAEEYIHGREFNVSVIDTPDGPRALPVAEIVFRGFSGPVAIVGYEAKWDEASFAYHNTPRRYDFNEDDAVLIENLKRLSLACGRLFGLRGYYRIDYRVDAGRHPFIIDVNANPCLSPDAGLAAAAARSHIDYTELVRIIALSGCCSVGNAWALNRRAA